MQIVYAVQVGDCGERIYYRTRREALDRAKRDERTVFKCELSLDAVIQLLNQQGRFIERETRIYHPK